VTRSYAARNLLQQVHHDAHVSGADPSQLVASFRYLCPCQLGVGDPVGFSAELSGGGRSGRGEAFEKKASFRDRSMRCSPAGKGWQGGRPSLA